MKKPIHLFLIALLSACGQPDVELPEGDGGGTCGTWYPSAGEGAYGFTAGLTLGCFEWGSVRKGPLGGATELRVNMAELNTWYRFRDEEAFSTRFGNKLSHPKALIIAVSQEACYACGQLLTRLSDDREYFHDNGVILLGVCGVSTDYEPLTAPVSDLILIEDDGWHHSLPRTHDPEFNLPEFSSFPQMQVVTLFDMKIIHTYDDAGNWSPTEIVESINTAIENAELEPKE